MKKLLYIFLLCTTLTACEEVIDVDVPENNPRLIVDALIRIDSDKTVTIAEISTKVTSSFFEEVQPADIDLLTITNLDYIDADPSDENSITFSRIGPGRYQAIKDTDFFTNGELQLNVAYNGQSYVANTEYVPSTPIINLEQGDDTLFGGDETEVEITFTDDGSRDDFYLVDFDFNEFLVTEDEFYNGQTFKFSYFYNDNVQESDEVTISVLGIDEPFFNYMNQLIIQSSGDQGPFQTPATTVRGNLINTATINPDGSFNTIENSDNFALGYFSVNETFSASLTIQ